MQLSRQLSAACQPRLGVSGRQAFSTSRLATVTHHKHHRASLGKLVQISERPGSRLVARVAEASPPAETTDVQINLNNDEDKDFTVSCDRFRGCSSRGGYDVVLGSLHKMWHLFCCSEKGKVQVVSTWVVLCRCCTSRAPTGPVF